MLLLIIYFCKKLVLIPFTDCNYFYRVKCLIKITFMLVKLDTDEMDKHG